ncbi:Eco57I restriction-modification methylase [Prevotella sp. BV3P1]|uniref:Eco57I restriction-modification methylase domain-containing protein n=1 Tax=Prevotella sp. BV3P1 TaxID=1111130 RepID=UPI0003B8765C|nr:N-6 DNA methylase [Prevotella sp. BV3P1]ERT60383.1 Eco57I restriction-modification methylase [Prevotella sp. BV3P1]
MVALSETINRTSSFVCGNSKADRKKYGQFFTPGTTAKFMASMFDIDMDRRSLKVLDAGAGSGILSVALISRMRESGYNGNIHLVCYENDVKVLGLLEENLASIKDANFSFEIRQENYITSQPFGNKASIFAQANMDEYDLIIGNPPYKKISKDAPEAKHMPEVCYGAPNLYFLFWAMGIYNLKEGGELVYIIPRSWTSGAYFEKFRKYLLAHGIITRIHLFGSRDKVFDGDSVLQETIIVKIKKEQTFPKKIRMSFSQTSNFSDIRFFDVDYNTIVAPNGYIYLVTNQKEIEVLSTLGKLSETLVSDDLRMKTGIIVDFRTREVLRSKGEKGAYPLFYAQHIKDGRIKWPTGKEDEYICTDKSGYLQENANYLFIKRFTSKEEKRRLQCGIYLRSDYPEYKYISTQNKINYIKCNSMEEVFGLYVLLNSTIYDQYYRILNGSTQVNSTEINKMPVPSKDTICLMGRELIGKDYSELTCNRILSRWIR